MRLYEIAEGYKNLVELIENSEDENIKEIVEIALQDVEGDLTQKVENICYLIRNWEADIKALKEEEKFYNIKRKRLEKAVENLKLNTMKTLENVGVEKVQGTKFKVATRKNLPKVIVREGFENENYRVIKFDIDKAKLKEDLKKGIEVDGAYLEVGKSLTIK